MDLLKDLLENLGSALNRAYSLLYGEAFSYDIHDVDAHKRKDFMLHALPGPNFESSFKKILEPLAEPPLEYSAGILPGKGFYPIWASLEESDASKSVISLVSLKTRSFSLIDPNLPFADKGVLSFTPYHAFSPISPKGLRKGIRITYRNSKVYRMSFLKDLSKKNISPRSSNIGIYQELVRDGKLFLQAYSPRLVSSLFENLMNLEEFPFDMYAVVLPFGEVELYYLYPQIFQLSDRHKILLYSGIKVSLLLD